MAFLIDHQRSTTKRFNAFSRWKQTKILMHFHLLMKSPEPLSICQQVKPQVLMLYRQKYSNQVVFHSPEDSLIFFVHIGKKKRSHKHLKTLPLYTFIKENKTNVHVKIIDASLFSQLRERSWLVFS